LFPLELHFDGRFYRRQLDRFQNVVDRLFGGQIQLARFIPVLRAEPRRQPEMRRMDRRGFRRVGMRRRPVLTVRLGRGRARSRSRLLLDQRRRTRLVGPASRVHEYNGRQATQTVLGIDAGVALQTVLRRVFRRTVFAGTPAPVAARRRHQRGDGHFDFFLVADLFFAALLVAQHSAEPALDVGHLAGRVLERFREPGLEQLYRVLD